MLNSSFLSEPLPESAYECPAIVKSYYCYGYMVILKHFILCDIKQKVFLGLLTCF